MISCTLKSRALALGLIVVVSAPVFALDEQEQRARIALEVARAEEMLFHNGDAFIDPELDA